MSSHFQVGICISCRKPPDFLCSGFNCWQSVHLVTNSAMSLFRPSHKYISLRSWYILLTPNELSSDTHVLILRSEPSTHLHREQTISLGTLAHHPPYKKNDLFNLPRTDTFNSIKARSRCCLDFTSTAKDDSEF